MGLGFLALGLGCLEVVLDKGQEEAWFASRMIVSLTLLAIVGIAGVASAGHGASAGSSDRLSEPGA